MRELKSHIAQKKKNFSIEYNSDEITLISDYDIWLNVERKIQQLCPLILPFVAKIVKIESKSTLLSSSVSPRLEKNVCIFELNI